MRLFIASPLSGPARETVETVYNQRATWAADLPRRITWVKPDHWHLTWLFLGEADPSRAAGIREHLQAAIPACLPAETAVENIVLWPNRRKARLIVCELSPTPKLQKLSDVIRNALPDFPADKPFNPHLTLARLKDEKRKIAIPGNFSMPAIVPTPWTVDTVILYQSTLTAAGPIYEPLARIGKISHPV